MFGIAAAIQTGVERMAPSGSKITMTAAELEAAIIKRLGAKPECEGIIYVYIKATGHEPPEDTWTHTLISSAPMFRALRWKPGFCTIY